MPLLPRYDRSRSYRWNYDHAPEPTEHPAAAVAGEWTFCGRSVDSPLGIAAGPLLNGKWCLYYAALGFDVLTYKTVRSGARECYPLPNLQPVECGTLSGSETRVAPIDEMRGSWAVSFGMPSSDPEQWRRDVEWTRERLPHGKLLSVSVVGTVQEGWGLEELAADYARCARWAVDSGADCIETNFSCPNVSTCDGQLYQDANQSRLVASELRSAIAEVPLILKIGHVASRSDAKCFVDALGTIVDGLSMTNSIAAKVGTGENAILFDGEQRGICGSAIHEASVDQIRNFSAAVTQGQFTIDLIGVGGISSVAHVRDYLDAGANACHLATSVMVDPTVGLTIREQFSK